MIEIVIFVDLAVPKGIILSNLGEELVGREEIQKIPEW
jgi:hypothetical protein